MNLYTLISMIHGNVWAIHEGYADSFLESNAEIDAKDYIAAHKEITAMKEKQWQQYESARIESRKETGSYFSGMLSQQGVLTLLLNGPVTEKTSSFSSDGIVTSQLSNILEMAYNDPAVLGLSAIVSTPGGIALPSLNIGESFKAFAAVKPYYAYTEGLLASAGLSLVSAADVSSSSHIVYGGLATVMRFYDNGKRMKANGYDYIAISSAPDKIASEHQNEDGSLSEASKKVMQAEIDKIGAGFNRQIKEMRGLDPAKPASFDSGGYFHSGKEAVKAGLANRVINTRREYRERVEVTMKKYNKQRNGK